MRQPYINGFIGYMIIIIIYFSNSFSGPLFGKAPGDREIAAFFEKETPAFLEKSHIAGGVVAVVQGGRTVFLRGFGFSDLEKKTPVDPQRTLFRPGSISKLITWTLVMQLVEEGKIDLRKDVKGYIDFELPGGFSQPIAMENLMSHTGGFEDRVIGLFSKDTSGLISLRDSVTQRIPVRVQSPGRQSSYSNYGVALAGYIAERISGRPFADLARERVFDPLGMDSSSFQQPLPELLAARMSKGYMYDQERWNEEAFEFVNDSPAGALSSTGADMANFMIMHLNDGEFNGARILGRETARRMHQSHFRLNPGINGFAHGFMELDRGEERIIGHGGDTIYFHSMLMLWPARRLGIFISFNTGTGFLSYNPGALIQQFSDTYFPQKSGSELAVQNPSDANIYSGSFAVNRRPESDFMKVISLLMAVPVEVSPQGGLMIPNLLTREMDRYVEIGPDLFQKFDGVDRVFFTRNEAGKAQSLIFGAMPVMMFVRPPFWESRALNLALLILGIFSLAGAVIFRPIGLLEFIRRKERTVAERRAGLTALALVIVHLGYFGWFAWILLGDFIFAKPGLLFSKLPWAGFVLGLMILGFSFIAWQKKFWSLPARLNYTFFAAGSLGLSAFFIFWKFAA